MKKKLTAGEIRIIECMAFQRAERKVAFGQWEEGFAKIYLTLVHNVPETHAHYLGGLEL